MLLLALLGATAPLAAANTPPRFVLDGQSEIVVRLTEGEATPVGKYSLMHGRLFIGVRAKEILAATSIFFHSFS